MRKRLLSLLLALVLLTGLVPAVQAQDGAVSWEALRADAVTLDGKADEPGWIIRHGAGFLWQGETLYLALLSDTASVTVNGVLLPLAAMESALGQVLEVAVPFSSFGFTLHDYGMSVDVSVDSVQGKLYFSDRQLTQRGILPTDSHGADREGQNGMEVLENGVLLYDRYVSGAKSGGRVYTYKRDVEVLQNRSRVSWIDLNICVESMPVYTVTGPRNDNWSGYGLAMTVTDDQYRVYCTSIMNTVNGLVFTAGLNGTAFYTLPLNRALGEEFRLSLGWTADDRLIVSVDGEQLGVLEGVVYPDAREIAWGAKSIMMLNLCRNGKAPASAADHMVVRVTDFSTGEGDRSSLLELLDGETLLGGNRSFDAVTEDLTLPAAVEDGILAPMALRWETSDASVVTADGRITRGEHPASAVLTARSVMLPQREARFTVTVLPRALHALYGSFGLPQLLPDGRELRLYWDRDKLELRLDGAGQTLTAALGETVQTAEFTDGTAQITLPLPEPVTDYNLGVGTLSLSVDGEAVYEAPVYLTSGYPEPIESFENKSAGVTVTDGVVTMSGGSDVRYILQQNLQHGGHTCDVTLSQTLKLENMPVSSGYCEGATSGEDYYFWLTTARLDGRAFFASVFHAGDDALKLRVSRGNRTESKVFDLGVRQGETFRLDCLWGMDESLEIYVNGAYVGVMENATFTSNYGGVKCLQLRLRDAAGATVTVSGVSLQGAPFASLAEEISTAVILGDTDPDAVTEDLILPDSFQSPMLGTVPLRWESSDEAVLSSDGRLNRESLTTYTPVDLSLYAFDRLLWTARLTVVPLQTQLFSAQTVTASFSADAITVDGRADEDYAMVNRMGTAGFFGAQWDESNLYLAMDAGALSLSLNGTPVSLANAVTDQITELAVPLADLGLAADRYDQRVSVTVTKDGESFSGTLILRSADWFTVKPTGGSGVTKVGLEEPTDKQGVERLDNGWRFYDLYDYDGENHAGIRSYLILSGGLESLKTLDREIFTEFDFYARSMPVLDKVGVTDWSPYFPSYGLSWSIAGPRVGSRAESVLFGIFNTADGLVLAARDQGRVRLFDLGRTVGQQVRIGTGWKTNGDVTVYVDGEVFVTLQGCQQTLTNYGNANVVMNLIREPRPAESRSDNYDVTVTGLCLGKSYGSHIMDALTFDHFRGANTEPLAIRSDLSLPAALSNGQLSAQCSLTWSSSEPAVISNTGTVTRPSGTGKAVTLTATAPDGTAREFLLYVQGRSADTSVLLVNHDSNPAVGVGTAADLYRFTLDANNNSIIRDLGASQTVSVVKLTDGDEFARLHENVITLWVSDDNKTYTKVDGFKLLHRGVNWYLYDFEAKGRYVKVHVTYFDTEDSDFTGSHLQMIDAYDEAVFGASALSGRQTVFVTSRETETRYDLPMEVPGVTGDNATRVFLGDELLYHTVLDGKVIARVPRIGAGETVTLTVFGGDPNAMDIANTEAVYEVSHGTREILFNGGYRMIHVLDDGTVLGMYCSGGAMWRSFSYDGGRTFVERQKIACTVGFMDGDGGGFIENPVTGRLIFAGFQYDGFVAEDKSQSRCKVTFICSDDNGKTWQQLGELQTDETYALSYSDPVILSTFDDVGPNVDFVLNMGVQYNDTGAFCCMVAYSVDGGSTWVLGDSKITFGNELGHEGGLSEGTILEREDGVLVLIVRCQSPDSDRFAQAWSYDHGVTWTTPAVHSNVYTCNTQPFMFKYDDAYLLSWGGNNVLGGSSYKRWPMTIGISYDGMETFRNLQDLYVKYSLQDLDGNGSRITNQYMRKWGEDTLLLTWHNTNPGGAPMLLVDDFTEYFYRTKGAWDSFEHGTVKYEGWATTAGFASVSAEQATEGRYSMALTGAAARSVPYLQQGTVSMNLYYQGGTLSVDLQSAYSDVYGKASPLGFTCEEGEITFLGQDAPCGLTLEEGWNSLVFDLNLPCGEATLTVNGQSKPVPVNLDIGDYVCFVSLTGGTVYVDEFCSQSAVDAKLPGEDADRFELAGASMTLDSDLTMNFFVRVGDARDGMTAKILRNGKLTEIPRSAWVRSGTLYRIAYTGIAAREMADPITVVICDGDGNPVSRVWYDSIRDYAMRMLVKSDDTELRVTLVDMLRYGAQAQAYFGYRTWDPADVRLDVHQQKLTSGPVTLTDLRQTASGYLGSSLELETSIVLKLVFSGDLTGQTAEITYTDHYGKVQTFRTALIRNGSYATVSVPMAVADCSAAVTCTVAGVTVTDSVESYCARMEQTLPLSQPLMKFAASAIRLFDGS